MPSQVITAVENNFTKGLITEFTGLNFPENAATDCDNVEFTLVGDVLRRQGVDFETNSSFTSIDVSNQAINTYKWNNVGGDGETQLLVVQVGVNLRFYDVTTSTTASPLSNNLLVSTVDVSLGGSSFDATIPCEFTDGNGYLFVFHPDIDPLYCTYDAGTITSNEITVQIRDFVGVPEAGVADNTRPTSLSESHSYNLQNQGWIAGNPWTASDTTSLITSGTGVRSFTVASGITGVSASQLVLAQGHLVINDSPTAIWMYGLVTSYGGTTLTINFTSVNNSGITLGPPRYYWKITPVSSGYITDWFSDLGNYPSNSDQWWRFKNTSDVFDPLTTVNNVTIGLGAAPKGHFIVDAFDQQRDLASGLSTITDITTTARPSNGCWFQGRVFYTGVNGSFVASGTAPFTTWTENIYFSQVVIKTDDFGKCYQTNDPTSETLFDLLPTDGGVITIQGSGPIYRLFPLQNGLLVFAANGVWFITGSQGIGFTANDYTITKISNIQSIATTSFVNVMGLPYFWNEEGIYQVKPTQQGGLEVDAITVGTILSFYNDIPLESKKNVRGVYHPIDYVIQWIYRSTNSTTTSELYQYDSILNYNVYNKAFYPYSISTTSGSIHGINYVSGPGGLNTVTPAFKYFSSSGTNTAFADIHDTDYVDWGADDYTSYFITGYKVHGQAQRRFQIPYLYMYSRSDGNEMSYKIQSMWDYTNSGNSGRWSSQQVTYIDSVYQNTVMKRHRLRGHGMALQFKVTSVEGQPFDIIGWSAYEVQNMSV